MKRLLILVIFIIPFRLLAQNPEPVRVVFNEDVALAKEAMLSKYDRFFRQLTKRLMIGPEVYERCEAFFNVVVFHVRNKKGLDTLTFDENCLPAVQEGFNRIIPTLKGQDWKEVIPEINSLSNFDIVMTLAYSYKHAGCWDTIPQKIINWKLDDAMDKRKADSIRSFSLKPFVFTQL